MGRAINFDWRGAAPGMAPASKKRATGSARLRIPGHLVRIEISCNYQSKVDKLNADTKEEIVVQLVELEQEQKRLEYYVSLLQKRQSAFRAILRLRSWQLSRRLTT